MLDGRKATSLNYLGTQLLVAAGLPLRDYDLHLLDLQNAVPAINAYGYMDSDGKWRIDMFVLSSSMLVYTSLGAK